MADPETIEVAAEEAAPDPAAQDAKETRESLKGKGWTAEELDAAEKRGMIEKPSKEGEDKAAQAAADKAKKDTEAKAAAGAKPNDSSLPDFTINDPVKEKAFLDAFGAGTPQRAMYFRMKNERQARQRAEERATKVEAELEAMRARAKKPDELAPEVDADGNVIDPDDKPLTMKQLKAMHRAEQEALDARQKEFSERSGRVNDALKTQEEYAKSTMPDFEDTVKLAIELIENIDAIPEKWKRDKVAETFNRMKSAAQNADKYGVDDYNASMLAYEIGQMHESYGQKPEHGETRKADPKANGGLTPAQMERIKENTERRASSASLPSASGGKRSVSVDEVTLKDINKMSSDDRFAFKKKHQAQYDKLMRG